MTYHVTFLGNKLMVENYLTKIQLKIYLHRIMMIPPINTQIKNVLLTKMFSIM